MWPCDRLPSVQPLNLLWTQLVWLAFGCLFRLKGLHAAFKRRQYLLGEHNLYDGDEETYPEFVSAMLRLVEDPLQLIANVLIMVLAPQEVSVMNVVSLVFTCVMILKTFLTLPEVMYHMGQMQHGE